MCYQSIFPFISPLSVITRDFSIVSPICSLVSWFYLFWSISSDFFWCMYYCYCNGLKWEGINRPTISNSAAHMSFRWRQTHMVEKITDCYFVIVVICVDEQHSWYSKECIRLVYTNGKFYGFSCRRWLPPPILIINEFHFEQISCKLTLFWFHFHNNKNIASKWVQSAKVHWIS